MLTLTTIDLTQYTPDTVTITWQFESTPKLFSDYRLSIYKSQAPETDLSFYDLVASGINPQTTNIIYDSMRGVTNKFITYWYVMLVSGLSGQGTFQSEPYHIEVQEDRIAREIQRRRQLVFDYHSGNDFPLLKRRDYGTVCPTCFDPILQRTTMSKCLTCYDTGYLGGYYPDIHVQGQLNERPVRETYQMFMSWQDQDAVFYSPAEPHIKPKDIVVDRQNRRWIVLNVGTAQKSMHAIGQISQLRQIEKADIIYQVPVTF